MPSYVIAAVLFAALMHASWNALVKSAPDTGQATTLVALGGSLLAALALPFLPPPARESWPYIAASCLIQVVYFYMLVATYRDGDISHAYPLMRGTAPLLVALATGPLTGERLAPMQWLSVAGICGGILALYFSAPKGHGAAHRTTILALLTACLIAAYTMVDGIGVRLSHAPAAYTMWIFLWTGLLFAVRAAPRGLLAAARAQPFLLLGGGVATIASYGIALWAMTRAPVAAVAALRETSIFFATAIAVIFLKERVSLGRVCAIALVAGGAACMRLA